MTSNPDFRALEPVAPLPLADAVATAEGECLYFLTTETGRSLTPDLIESLYGQFRGIIAGLVDALAQAEEPAAPEVVGPEWQPCVKLPITVHVREQRPGEQHVSTREGIAPVLPDDLIMRGVAGEEYPICRKLFQRSYRMGSADEPAVPLPLADTHYEWELVDAEGEWQAGGSSNGQADVKCEGMRYLQGYAQDGAHKLIIRQHTTQIINEITNG